LRTSRNKTEKGLSNRNKAKAMNHARISSEAVVTAAPLILDAARSWRAARDAHEPVQPNLFEALRVHGCGMLAPVFDSLMTLCEAALGRRLSVGGGATISDDEHLLLGLLEVPSLLRFRIHCGEGPASALGCALRSTRIMLRLTLEQPRAAAAAMAPA
jgi:hypothetical protein